MSKTIEKSKVIHFENVLESVLSLPFCIVEPIEMMDIIHKFNKLKNKENLIKNDLIEFYNSLSTEMKQFIKNDYEKEILEIN